jgi:ubiquinone biosynthesis protein
VGSPPRRTERHHHQRAEKLVARVAKLGPTFIKLGQLMRARADIFPEPYLTAISALQDQAPLDPADQSIAFIERELGRPVDEVFDEFEREPAAADSFGQVHRAVVYGRSVAVKVLRPDVEELVALDLDISFRLLFWLNVLFPNHHIQALTNVACEFSHRVREEMDFRRESENTERFQRHFRDDATVRAPEVLDKYTRRRVLVMEHYTGTKIDQLHDKFTEGCIRFNDVMERLTGLCSCSCSCSCSSSRLIC